MRHVIKKQCFDLTLYEKEEAFRIQQLVSEHYYREIVHLIEKVFDNFSTPHHVIRIEKLEIDLGLISEKDIEKGRWKEMILKKMEEELALLRQRVFSDPERYVHPSSLSVAEQWMYYMEFGFLRWDQGRPQQSWQMKAIETFATDSIAVEKLRSLMHRSSRAVERMIAQHEVKFLVILAEVLSARTQKQLAAVVTELTKILEAVRQKEQLSFSIPPERRSIRKYLWENIFRCLSGSGTRMTTEEITFHLMKYIFNEIKIRDTIPSKYFSGNKISALVLRRLRSEQQAKQEDGKSSKKSFDDEARKKHQKSDLIERVEDDEGITAKKMRASDVLEQRAPDEVHEAESDGVFVSDCGLLLLHPFLNVFFRRLELLEGPAFRDLHAHQKALSLLYYLATGKTGPEEYQLVVPKILCGYPLQQPVESDIAISDAEKEEGDALLHSVIGHWDILRDTSPDGLRESFLQREGKLFTDQDCFCFRVESRGIDILLDHLPWNISVIQLPWRKELIKVDWR